MAEISQQQKEEALKWLADNCSELLGAWPDTVNIDLIIDVYFKLKTISFPFKPKEFVIGVDYINKEKVAVGEEKVSITFQNPHLPGVGDPFAQQVVLELLQRLKG